MGRRYITVIMAAVLMLSMMLACSREEDTIKLQNQELHKPEIDAAPSAKAEQIASQDVKERPTSQSKQVLLPTPTSQPSIRPTKRVTVRLLAARDNTLYENEQGNVSNGEGQHFFAGVTDEMLIRRGLISFNIANKIPPGSRVIHVELILSMSRSVGGEHLVKLHRALSEWGEGQSDAPGHEGRGVGAAPGDATWLYRQYRDSLWVRPGGDYALAVSSEAKVSNESAVYTWESTPAMVHDVQHWVDSIVSTGVQFWQEDSESNFGWILIGEEGSPRTAKRFDSKENKVSNNRPLLVVRYETIIGS